MINMLIINIILFLTTLFLAYYCFTLELVITELEEECDELIDLLNEVCELKEVESK